MYPPILASNYVKDGADNTAAVVKCLSDAANEHTKVILPAMDIDIDGPLTLPAGFTGGIELEGLGQGLSRFVQQAAGADGLTLDLSSGSNRQANFVKVHNLSIVAGAVCGTPLTITYGLANIPSSEYNFGSVVSNVEVTSTDIGSTGWVNGINLVNCWHALLEKLYLRGSATNWAANQNTPGVGGNGPGSGYSIRLGSGVNNILSKITCEFWSQAFRFEVAGTAAGQNMDSQGVNIDAVQVIQASEALHVYGSAAKNFAAFNLSNFLIDNGNIQEAYNMGLVLENVDDFKVKQGSMYQVGGPSAIKLVNCTDGVIDGLNLTAPIPLAIDCYNCQGLRGDNLILRGPGKAIQLDAASSYNTFEGIKGQNGTAIQSVDLGQNNKVGETYEVNTVISFPAGFTGTSFTFTVDITHGNYAKTPVGVVTVTSDDVHWVRYDWDNSTASTASLVVTMKGGGALQCYPFRVNLVVGPA